MKQKITEIDFVSPNKVSFIQSVIKLNFYQSNTLKKLNHLLDMKDLKSAYHHLTMEFKLSLKRIPSLEKEVVQLKSEIENAQHHGHVVYEADDMGLTNVEHEDVEPRHVSN